jgi:hypothetical protein
MDTNNGRYFPYIKISFLIILMIIITIFLLTRGTTIMNQATGKEYSSCGYSKYNIYSNSTEAYENIWGTKCYIPVISGWYEDKEKCGFLGISCYERSEPINKPIESVVCFYKKTGERC